MQVAAAVFSVSPALIKITTTNTSRIANASPSAASATADLNGKAVWMACTAIANRLKSVIADELQIDESTITLNNGFICINTVQQDISWKQVVTKAFFKRINLSEHAHYTTPDVHFDKTKEKGHPFAYHVFGSAITEVTVDCLRGTYQFDSVKLVHDF